MKIAEFKVQVHLKLSQETDNVSIGCLPKLVSCKSAFVASDNLNPDEIFEPGFINTNTGFNTGRPHKYGHKDMTNCLLYGLIHSMDLADESGYMSYDEHRKYIIKQLDKLISNRKDQL